MAISVTFNGATIYKPGAYSKLDIDLGGGFPLGPAGLVAIFGEADQGAPGAEEADIRRNVFTAEQLPEIRRKYGKGSIVDAASFLFAPATDAGIPSGAQAVYIYKTNASQRAKLALPNNYGDVKAEEYGDGGNRISFKVEHTKEVGPEIKGADITDLAATDAKVMKVRVGGEAQQTVTISAAPANIAALVADIQGQLTGVDVSAEGNKLVLALPEDAQAHRKGLGKTLSIDGVTADLAALGLASQRAVSLVESAATLTAVQRRDLIQEQDTVGGGVILELGYIGAEATAEISIDGEKLTLKEGAVTTELTFAQFATINELAAEVNARTGWKAKVANTLAGQLSPSILDEQSNVSALADSATKLTVRVKRDYDAAQEYFEQASLVRLEAGTTKIGLPDETTNAGGDVVAKSLSGGVIGGTSTAEIVNALNAFEEIRVNSVVPLFSRNATDDIIDGLTDASSAYTIEGIHQAVKTHVNFMSTTKQKSERQGYLSVKAAFTACQEVAENLADARLQLMIQDARQLDSRGQIRWFLPWALACMLAGARAGSPVGTPMTFKFLNASGVRHTAQALSTAEENVQIDFNPRTQADVAIRSGITFTENPPSGGHRVVVDNTTYGKDMNWVQNRGNVRYAADILSYELRSQLEDIYVGQKNIVRPTEIKSTVETIMAQFLAQGITVSTADAPNGFKELVVKLEGNIIRVSLVAKLVEGIDFVLADITVQRATGEA